MKSIAARLGLALVVFLQLAACAEDTLEGRVVGVTDGDTIVVLVDKREHKIRLHGVDAPERKQAFGTRARQFASDLVFGKDVAVDVVDMDRYGRHVGVVRLRDGRILNHELVKAGMAWWYEDYAPKDAALKAMQADAQGTQCGLWADAHPIAPWEFRKQEQASRNAAHKLPAKPAVDHSAGASTTGPARGNEFVFVTRTGKKYHKTSCRFARHAEKVSLDDAVARGYAACKLCEK